MQQLLIALLQGATPLVLKAITDWQARTGRTDLPTPDEIHADYTAVWQAVLAEGKADQASRRPTP